MEKKKEKKIHNNQKTRPTQCPKRRKNPKVSRRKKIRNIGVEINDIEISKTIKNINETNSWFFEKINIID